MARHWIIWANRGVGVMLRWVLIQKYHLKTEEAIRLLGGKETDSLRRVLILYLQKEKAPMQEAFYNYIGQENNGAGNVLASWAEVNLLGLSPGIKEDDLRVPGAKSIEQAVVDKLSQYGKQ